MSVLSAKGIGPLSVMQLLDRAFRIYRENFFTIILPVLIFTVPSVVISMTLTESMQRQVERSTYFASQTRQLEALLGLYGQIAIIQMIILFLQTLVINSLITLVVADSQFGTKSNLKTLVGRMLKRLPGLFGAMFLYFVIGGALWIGMALISFGCGFGLGLALYITVVMYAFIVPVSMLEEVDVGLAMRRAWWLAKTRFWPVMGVMVFGYLIAVALNVALASFLTLLTDGMLGQLNQTFSDGLAIALQVLASTFVLPIVPLALALLYFDSRIRLEAFDVILELQSTSDIYNSLSPQPPGNLFIGKDIGNIVKLSLGILGMGIVLYGVALLIASSGI